MSESAPPGAGAPAGAAGPGARRWVVLFAGLFAMTAGCTFQYGLAYLIPAFRAEGLSLEQAGILVACPTAGLLLTLVAWGAAADRWGERLVLGAGLALAGAVLLAGTTVHGTAALGACLALAGAAGASVYAASGRLILGWFPARQRGLAMGIRQSAQPLGVAVAALALPPIGAHGWPAALAFLGTFCLVAAVLVAAAVRDPARPPRHAQPRAARPTGGGRRTARTGQADRRAVADPRGQRAARRAPVRGGHVRPGVPGRCARARARHGRPAARRRPGVRGLLPARRGRVVRPGGQPHAPDAGARPGHRADPGRAGGRGRRPVAWAVAALFAAVIVAVSTNGLAFTAVAEHAGPSWAGRALGIQNTGQNAFAAATPPVLAAVIGAVGYPAAFGMVALFPLAASALVPVGGERQAPALDVRAAAPDVPAGR